jgi:hypothetical protein
MHRTTPIDPNFVSIGEIDLSHLLRRDPYGDSLGPGLFYEGRQESSSGHASILVDLGQDAMGTPDTDAGPDESEPWKEEPNAIGHSLIHLAAPSWS